MKNTNNTVTELVVNHFNTKVALTWSECREVELATGNTELVEKHFNTKEPLTYTECKTLVESV
jgi:hypothetical protein